MNDSTLQNFANSLDNLFRHGDSNAYMKQQEASNIRLIEDAMLAIGRNDMVALKELIADNVQLDIKTSADLPFIRAASGKEKFLDAVKHNFSEISDQQPRIEAVIAQGDTVIILSSEEGEIRASGARYHVQGMHRFVCRDGKLELVQELIIPA